MSELFGPLPRHAIAGVPLLVAVASPLVAAVAVAAVGPWLDERPALGGLAKRAGARVASDLVVSLAALLAAVVVGFGLVQAAQSPSGMVVSPAWVVARVGSIEAALGFDADVGRAAVGLTLAIGGAVVALRGGVGPGRAAWRSLALGSGLAALLADGAATALLALGGALVATGAASLRGRWAPASLAVVALALSGTTLGWGLDGRWLDGLRGNYLSDYGPRFVAVRDAPPKAARPRGPGAGEGKGSLSMTSAPGAEVFTGASDDTSLRGRSGPLATSPFRRVSVPASLQKIAIVPGAAAIVGGDGLEVALADNVDIRAGDDIVLTPLGGTWTWRDVDAQLLLRDAQGKHPLRSAFASKRLAGMAIPTAALLLAFLAAAFTLVDGPRRVTRSLASAGKLDAALVAAVLGVAAVAPASRMASLVPLASAAVLVTIAVLVMLFGVLVAASRGAWFAAGCAVLFNGTALVAIAADAPPVLALGVALASALAIRFVEDKTRREPHAWIAGQAEDDDAPLDKPARTNRATKAAEASS